MQQRLSVPCTALVESDSVIEALVAQVRHLNPIENLAENCLTCAGVDALFP